MSQKTEVAVFGGGCFWCTEAVFGQLKGVVSVMPGYAGGTTANPTYGQVCTGDTGHAEVVRVEHDPSQVAYNDLLVVFFATHDPTSLNRQGADVGTEYRSVILYTTDDQKRNAQALIEQLNNSDPEGKRIVTEVLPLKAFYEAENYHREYYGNNSLAPYCQIVINPKLRKLHQQFSALLKSSHIDP
ncbi:MAG TPA: peptide-methionine (S)-S-oxide reductase MsrA [Candidatus Binataceae bacterium]|nr:peptide-methionine (S)-S-oxide reductase MsrA [Candidatus Binataceae bacterium]